MNSHRASNSEIRAAQAGQPISFDQFLAVDLRVGTIVGAEPFPAARRPAYKLWIDFGDLGILKSSAQITVLYDVADLPGMCVVAVVNFPPKQIADFMSEVLLLGAPIEGTDSVVLLRSERAVPAGSIVR